MRQFRSWMRESQAVYSIIAIHFGACLEDLLDTGSDPLLPDHENAVFIHHPPLVAYPAATAIASLAHAMRLSAQRRTARGWCVRRILVRVCALSIQSELGNLVFFILFVLLDLGLLLIRGWWTETRRLERRFPPTLGMKLCLQRRLSSVSRVGVSMSCDPMV